MSKYILILDKKIPFETTPSNWQIVTPTAFITNDIPGKASERRDAKIINLCSGYDYLSRGYYCSLLAEARGQRVIPSVASMIDMNWKRLYQTSLSEINALLQKHLKAPEDDTIGGTFLIYFGRTESDDLQPIARRLFDIFRFPVIALTIRYHKKWQVEKIDYHSLNDIPPHKMDFFMASLNKFTGTAWIQPSSTKHEKYWLGILHDPQEKLPPSDKGALKKFMNIGKKMDIAVELITKADLPSILEYDALFIRETTAIDHHTYRFAHKAEREGIPCIDDTASIMRCCNKVFLHELLSANKVPTPHTVILDRKRAKKIEEFMSFPLVVKIPDGSFSRGICKAHSRKEFDEVAAKLFEDSDILLAQEFMASEFDWRVGILNGRPLFASRYFMVKNHWQIYKHSDKGKTDSGGFETMAIDEAPADVIQTALKAANLIGRGLYGVDLKQTEKGVFVIEVNDNPNIDSGIEDKILGDKLYKIILQHFIDLIEKKDSQL